MNNWTRAILTPHRDLLLIIIPAVLYFLWEGLAWQLAWATDSDEWIERLHWPRDIFAVVAAVAVGASRATLLNPVFIPEYRTSLLLTPWTAEKPLPAGPLIIGWVDGLLVAVLIAVVAYRPNIDPWRIPLMMLVGYVVHLCISFVAAGLLVHCYSVAFGLGLVLRVWQNYAAAASILVVLVLISVSGVRHTLRQMRERAEQYDNLAWMKSLAAAIDPANHQKPKQIVGWPFELLQPQQPGPSIGVKQGLLVSLLIGWWLYAIFAVGVDLAGANQGSLRNQMAERIEQRAGLSSRAAEIVRNEIIWTSPEPDRMGIEIAGSFVLLAFAIACCARRLTVYLPGHRPPISLWGRIWTLRWIVPSYDNVLLAPLYVSLVVVAFWMVTAFLPLSPVVTVPAAVTLMCLISLNMGPTLAQWQLTSHCRLVVPAATKNKRQFIEA